MDYEPVIGLEIHAQLKTESKIFCSCATAFGAEPNTQVCPICAGMPGTLPKLNKKVVNFAIKKNQSASMVRLLLQPNRARRR
jgi:aspartyl-tRNA(Asn)/glutamyl-tRNA(Gln) amidotransferase subunit B